MEHASKKLKVEIDNLKVNPNLTSVSAKESLSTCYKGEKSKTLDNGAEVIKEPFECCILPDFVNDETFLNSLKDSILDLNFEEKNNDLYKFHQSDDLKNCKNSYISAFRELLYGDFLLWLQDVTGIQLNKTIDMSCSRYDYTDVLLCHDDQLKGRRIAYIYYLVPNSWNEKDGGTLDLFNKNSEGQPETIVRSVIPKWNNFVFFEVTPFSFHQVSEILTPDKCRLSISGWFHCKSSGIKPSLLSEPKPILYSPVFLEEDVLRAWVNPTYLKDVVQMEIQEKFEKGSEIELVDFLRKEKYDTLSECLKSDSLSWSLKGPANKKRLHELDLSEQSLPSILKDCLQLFKSEAMFLILSNMTGLSLHSLMAAKTKGETLNEEERATCECAIRKFQHGDYTLLKDKLDQDETDALDATLFCNVFDWEQSFGGYTSYIAKGEDEELLTVLPQSNTLALVYRDKETLKFVKHINSLVLEEKKSFEDIHLVYYE